MGPIRPERVRDLLFVTFIVVIVLLLGSDQWRLQQLCEDRGGRAVPGGGRRSAPEYCEFPAGTRVDLRDLDDRPTPLPTPPEGIGRLVHEGVTR